MKPLLDVLSERSGVSLRRLEWLECKCSAYYKVYQIPKRSGGFREICQPTPEVKSLQRWLSAYVLKSLPLHSSATAYSRGSSIRKNAERHLRSAFTLHLDFEDFFPSFRRNHIVDFLKDSTAFSVRDCEFVASILTRNECLTIGAPSSPIISNVMMFDFDHSVAQYCKERKLIYTRYADDINISSLIPNTLENVADDIAQVASSFPYADLKLNSQKTAYLSRKFRRSITGVNLTSDGKISIGRERKREIKTLVFLASQGKMTFEERWRVGGLIAFASDVEPSFVAGLNEKYGKALIDDLLHKRIRGSLKLKASIPPPTAP
jgi:RNA-directed DNA polymerase